MTDNRKGLPAGTKLKIGGRPKIRVCGEAGRGAGCIVYYADYMDNVGNCQRVRLKECYPYEASAVRHPDGTLEVEEAALERFREAHRRNTELKNTMGLTNSTANVKEIYAANGTLYSVLEYSEGCDYRNYQDESLKELFLHVRTLALLIKRYHDRGYLYLDLKPENIWILPETKEHVLLFDFDSIILEEDFKKGEEVPLSFSDGFSAPEQIAGRADKVGKASDIYALGALVYYKLFGHAPAARDGELGALYDYSGAKYYDKSCDPQLFWKLDELFRNALSLSPVTRWADADCLVKCLDELILLSDMDAVFLYDNFSYHNSCFVGRARELAQLDEMLARHRVIFLSGIGGIGKTELAKYYANANRGQYGKIVFLPFSGSIEDAVCGADIRLHNFTQAKGEERSAFFERKLSALKALVRPEDLIILDNFDVEWDENLERLLECGCHFIVTSREDFGDFNYAQLNVDCMEDAAELLMLFRAYNAMEYPKEQQDAAEQILSFLDYHTMTVELAAKYLRDSKEQPVEFLARLQEKEGIAGTGELRVKHRKDKSARAGSVREHLLLLFDLTGFSDGERELMMSLSLLGFVKVRRQAYLEQELDRLIRHGWVEWDEDSGKVSLHQVILDLVYHQFHPTAEDCPYLTAAMTEYAARELSNSTEYAVRKRFLEGFLQRLTGENLGYAKLCMTFCANAGHTVQYLDRAWRIYEKDGGKESKAALAEICLIGLNYGVSSYDYNDQEDVWLQTVTELAQNAYRYAGEAGFGPDKLCSICLELEELLNRKTYDMEFVICPEKGMRSFHLDRVYDYEVFLLDEAEKFLLEADMTLVQKESCLKKILRFYHEDNSNYHSRYYMDLEKARCYQEQIDKLRQSMTQEEKAACSTSMLRTGSYVSYYYGSDAGFLEIADQAREEGLYEKALEYYQKAIEAGEGEQVFGDNAIYSRMAKLYIKTGRTDRAVACYEDMLRKDKEEAAAGERAVYSSFICYDLIQLLLSEQEYEKAENYAKEMVYYETQDLKKEVSDYGLTWFIVGNYCLYRFAREPEKKESYWNNCEDAWSRIQEKKNMTDELFDFLYEYFGKMEEEEKKIEGILDLVQNNRMMLCDEDKAPRLLDLISGDCRKKEELFHFYFEVSLEYANYYDSHMGGNDPQKAIGYLDEALLFMQKHHIEDAYWQSLLHKKRGECCLSLYEYEIYISELGKCDFYLIAQREEKGKKIEERLEIWKNAADKYFLLDAWADAERCYQELFAILPVNLFYEYWSVFWQRTDALSRQQNQRKIYDSTVHILPDLIQYAFEYDEDIEPEEKPNWFHRVLNEAAGCFRKAGAYKEALILHLLSAIAASGRLERTIYENWMLYLKGDFETLHAELRAALHMQMSPEAIDDVLETWENIKDLPVKDEIYPVFEQEFLWFTQTYQHQTVEFKR